MKKSLLFIVFILLSLLPYTVNAQGVASAWIGAQSIDDIPADMRGKTYTKGLVQVLTAPITLGDTKGCFSGAVALTIPYASTIGGCVRWNVEAIGGGVYALKVYNSQTINDTNMILYGSRVGAGTFTLADTNGSGCSGLATFAGGVTTDTDSSNVFLVYPMRGMFVYKYTTYWKVSTRSDEPIEGIISSDGSNADSMFIVTAGECDVLRWGDSVIAPLYGLIIRNSSFPCLGTEGDVPSFKQSFGYFTNTISATQIPYLQSAIVTLPYSATQSPQMYFDTTGVSAVDTFRLGIVKAHGSDTVRMVSAGSGGGGNMSGTLNPTFVPYANAIHTLADSRFDTTYLSKTLQSTSTLTDNYVLWGDTIGGLTRGAKSSNSFRRQSNSTVRYKAFVAATGDTLWVWDDSSATGVALLYAWNHRGVNRAKLDTVGNVTYAGTINGATITATKFNSDTIANNVSNAGNNLTANYFLYGNGTNGVIASARVRRGSAMNTTDSAFIIDNAVGSAKFLQVWKQNGSPVVYLDSLGKIISGNIKINYATRAAATDTAFVVDVGSPTLLMALLNKGANKFKVDSSGNGTFGNNLTVAGGTISSGAGSNAIITVTGAGSGTTIATPSVTLTSASSATTAISQVGVRVNSTINQTGSGATASATDLQIQRTSTSAGTGTQRLFSAGVSWGGTYTEKVGIDTAGSFKTLGGLTLGYRGVTATGTILPSDYMLNVTTANDTLTLPTAASIAGRVYVVKNSAATGTVTVRGFGGTETIDGATTYVLAVQYTSVTIMSDGTNWITW